MHFKFDLLGEHRTVPENECLVRVYNVCLCWGVGASGGWRREGRAGEKETDRRRESERFSSWPTNERLELDGEGNVDTRVMSSCFSLGGTDSWVEGHFYNKIMGKRETEIYRQVEALKETEAETHDDIQKDTSKKAIKDVHKGEWVS